MIPPNHKVVLVDLDDTIIDYGGSAAACWQTVCEMAADERAGLDAEALLQSIHRTRNWFWSDPERHRLGRADLRAASRSIVEKALLDTGHSIPGLADALAGQFRKLRNAAMRLFPGSIETLQRLRDRGHRLGLVTNGTSADQRSKIDRFQLSAYFEAVLIEGELGYGKPDARVYIEALTRLGADAEDTWFIGDNLEWDIAAPQRAGMRTIWIDGAGSGLPATAPARPDHVIAALSHLP